MLQNIYRIYYKKTEGDSLIERKSCYIFVTIDKPSEGRAVLTIKLINKMELTNNNFEKELLDVIFGKTKQMTIFRNGIETIVECQSTIKTAFQNAKYIGYLDKTIAALTLRLIALEQIGDLFCVSEEDTHKNGIAKAVKTYMPELSLRERQGVVHLRHSLAHNFGRACIDEKQFDYYTKENNKLEKKGEQTKHNLDECNYKYILHLGTENLEKEKYALIKRPNSEWDGKFQYHSLIDVASAKLNSCDSFEVCVPLLIERIDGIFNDLKKKHQANELHFVSKSGNGRVTNEELCEIAFKYFIYNF